MEVGIPQSLSALEKSFLPTSRLSLDSNVLDVKLASSSQFSDKDDEGEIMLLAMILLQLHGVPKLPTTPITPTTTTIISTPTTTTTILPVAPESPASDDEGDLGNKKKRQRTSPDQLAILEQIFQTDKMPNPQTRGQLADQLGMSSRRVQIWFQNKRAKVKRSSMKQDGEECSSPNSLAESSASIPPPSPTIASDSSSPSPSTPSTPFTTTITNATSPSLSTSKSTPSLTVFTSSTTSTTTASDTILADTAKQLKAQQQQFSLRSPFVENQPLLAASY